MNKVELIKAVAEKTGYTQKDIKEVMSAVQEVVFDTLPNEEVKVMDGVTLRTDIREARTGRNPHDGSTIQIPEKRVPKCKFGTAIKSAVAL